MRFNNIKATIKIQLRDVDTFIHKDFPAIAATIRYIAKTIDTQMSHEHFATLVQAIRQAGCITSATPFDEASVDFCSELEFKC